MFFEYYLLPRIGRFRGRLKADVRQGVALALRYHNSPGRTGFRAHCNRRGVRASGELPLHAGIKAGNAVNPVANLAGHIKLQDGLRVGFLCYFLDPGVVRISGQKTFIKLDIAVIQQFDTPYGR